MFQTAQPNALTTSITRLRWTRFPRRTSTYHKVYCLSSGTQFFHSAYYLESSTSYGVESHVFTLAFFPHPILAWFEGLSGARIVMLAILYYAIGQRAHKLLGERYRNMVYNYVEQIIERQMPPQDIRSQIAYRLSVTRHHWTVRGAHVSMCHLKK